MSIKARTKYNGTVGIIELKGSLIGDGDTDIFREYIADFLEQGIKRLVIDLRKVHYLNSTGIGAIISAHTSYKKLAGEVKLAGISNNVENLLVVTKLIDVFDVYDTVDEAIATFGSVILKT